MADQADKSDDLIAELARLMASTASTSDEKAPSTVKVTPPPAAAAPSRIRIPGMDTPVDVPSPQQKTAPQALPAQAVPQPRPAAPTIRIPGMDQPFGVSPAQKPAVENPASPKPAADRPLVERPSMAAAATPRVEDVPAPKPVAAQPPQSQPQPQPNKFDFGALPDIKAVVNSEPLSVLQQKQMASPAVPPPVVAPPPLANKEHPSAQPAADVRTQQPALRPSVHPEMPAVDAARDAARAEKAPPPPLPESNQAPQQVRFEPRIPSGPVEPPRVEPVAIEPVRVDAPSPAEGARQGDDLPTFTRAEAREPGPVRFESPKVEAPRIDISSISVPRAEQPRPEPQRNGAPATARRVEPTLDAVSESRRPQQQSSAPGPAGAGDFDFDFGFGGGAQQGGGRAQAGANGAVDPNVLDPIAALIRADLDAADARAAAAPQPRVNLDGLENKPAPVQRAAAAAPPVLHAMRGPSPARREPETDSFAVPPIAPRQNGQERAAPASDEFNDPMAEIESLIGEAVRVDLTPREMVPPRPQAQAPAPAPMAAPRQGPANAATAAPVVPPLGGQFPPRKSAIKEPDSSVEAAEQAIMAAAAATGADIGRVDNEGVPAEGKYRRARRQKAERSEGSGLRPFIGLALAGVLLVAASLGLYWVLNTGRDDGAAPVLSADAGPAKVAAPATGATDEQQSVVFNQLDGVTTSGGEQLVPRDETNVADVIAEVPPSSSAEASENELANRKVRTVTVRPDGTIVSSDEAVAGTSALPVDRPNVPQLPGGLTAQSELLAATENQPRTILPNASGTTPAGSPPAGTLALAPSTPAATTAPAAPVQINPDATLNTALVAPVPQPRLTNRESRLAALSAAAPASNPVTAVIGEPAAPAASPAVTAPAVSTGGSANAYVQMMSLPTEGEARQQAGIIQSRWGNLFNGQGLVIQRAELNGGRVTYRVRLPANSLQSATQICAAIKSNGGDCFATNS